MRTTSALQIIVVLALLFSTGGCTKSEILDSSTTDATPKSVAFKTNVGMPQTKGIQVTTLNNNSFALFVYKGSDGFALSSDKTIRNNMKINVNNAGECSYDNSNDQLFWPDLDKLSFYGYAPFNAVGVTNLTPSVADAVTPPAFDFAVQDNVIDQVDLLLSRVEDKNSASSSTVALPFRHALTKVTVQARTETSGYQIQITAISFNGFLSTGKYSVVPQTNRITAQNTVWGLTPTAGSEKNYTAILDFNGLNHNNVNAVLINTNSTYTAVTDPNQPLLLLPQVLNTSNVMQISYSIINPNTGTVLVTNKVENIDLSHNDANIVEWNLSQAVNYRLTFNSPTSGGGSAISFTTTVSGWTSSSDVDYDK